MSITEPQPLTLDPKTLNEKLVQETMEWMSTKNTEDLKNMIIEETHQTGTYAPEIIEAAQRVLANRQELEYPSTLGEYFPHIFEQQVEAKFPEGKIRIFKSHDELQTAVLEGQIPIGTFIRPIKKKLEKSSTKEAQSESEWAPLPTYTNFSALYTPILFSIKWGVILGTYLGFGIFSGQLRILPFKQPFNNYSFALIDEFFISLFILFGLMALLFWDKSQKKEWISNLKFGLGIFILSSVIFNVGEIIFGNNTWEEWEFRNFIWEVFLVNVLVINSAIFGGPVGAILGTAIGHIRSSYFPKAKNAKAEGMKTYQFGLLYPTGFILIAWPLTYFWLYPWFLSTFPATLSN